MYTQNMRQGYRAILKGDRLEWQDGSPTTEDRAVAVWVTLVDDEPQRAQRGRRMAAALGELAASNAFADLEDAAAWERQLREERELPNRS